MNTERPLFQHPDRINLRKAVNFAIDRPAIIAQRGYAAGPASDQLIPPGVPGFVDEDIYPLDGPDIVQARLLAGWQPGDPLRPAVFYTCSTGLCLSIAQIIRNNLLEIGIDSQIQAFPTAVCFTKIGTRGEPFDLANCTGNLASTSSTPGPYPAPVGDSIRPRQHQLGLLRRPCFQHRIVAARLLPKVRPRARSRRDRRRHHATPRRTRSSWSQFARVLPRRIGCHKYDVLGSLMNLAALCERPEIAANDVQVTEAPPGTTNAGL